MPLEIVNGTPTEITSADVERYRETSEIPEMPDLTDRQFGEGLWRDGLITFDEYLGFVGPGRVPDDLMVIVASLPDDDTGGPTPRKVALGQITGAKSYQFANAFVEPLRQAMQAGNPVWTPEFFRQRWLAWSVL